MSASFPTAVTTKPINIIPNQTVLADHVGTLWDEMLAVQGTLVGDLNLNLRLRQDNAGDQALGVRRASDTNERIVVTAGGSIALGSGSAGTDVTLSRSGTRSLGLAGNLVATAQSANDVPLQLVGASGQTTALTVKTSANTVVASISGAGDVTAATATVAGALSAGTTTLGATTTGALGATTVAASGNATVGGTLGVTGTSTLAVVNATSATLSGTLGVTGNTTLNNLAAGTTTATALTVSGSTALAATSATTVTTTGNVSVGGTLGVTSTATVTGATTLNGTLQVNAAATVTGNLTATAGSVSLGATQATSLTTTGAATVGGAAAVTGLLTASGGVATKTKAGTPVDGDFTSTPPNGTLVVNTSTAQLAFRSGGSWVTIQPEYTEAFLMMGA